MTCLAAAVSDTSRFYIPEVIAGTAKPYVGRMGSLHEVGYRDSRRCSPLGGRFVDGLCFGDGAENARQQPRRRIAVRGNG